MKTNYKNSPGIIWAPWVVIPYRGKLLSLLDNLIIKIPLISKLYIKWLINQPHKIFNKTDSRLINKYKNRYINSNFYGCQI